MCRTVISFSKKVSGVKSVKTTRGLAYLVCAFMAGFVAGIVFSAWKLEKAEAPGHEKPIAQKEQNGQEQLRKRIAGLEKMLSVNPNNLRALVQLGNDYFDIQSYDKAVETYGKALKIDPKDADVLTDMGIAYRRMGKPQEAVAAFRSAVDADPQHALALFNMGIVLRDDLKDYASALKAWETFLEKAGETPHAVMVRPWVEQLRAKVSESPQRQESKE